MRSQGPYFYFPLKCSPRNSPSDIIHGFSDPSFSPSAGFFFSDSCQPGFFPYPFVIPQRRPGGSTAGYPPRMPCGSWGATWPRRSGWTWGACAASVGPSSAAAQLAPGAHSASTWKRRCTWTGTPDHSRENVTTPHPAPPPTLQTLGLCAAHLSPKGKKDIRMARNVIRETGLFLWWKIAQLSKWKKL